MAPVLLSVRHLAQTASVTWSAVAGQIYFGQYLDDLGTTNWTNLGVPITATNSSITVSDTSASSTSRVYRAVLMP